VTPAPTVRGRRPDLRGLPLPYLVVAAVLPLVLIGLLAWLTITRSAGGSPTAIGDEAPDFSLVSTDGETVRLSDLRGRPVILNFWASWCVPCIEEFPLLREAAEQHADDDLAIVGVIFDDGPETAAAFMEEHGGTWPALMDPGMGVAAEYGVFGPPETYFIGRDGRIEARQIGQFSERSLDEKLAAIIGGHD
jgi:cytochrome c biogenesis protein CcmG, thiol:disulfide interchange protein DsbE